MNEAVAKLRAEDRLPGARQRKWTVIVGQDDPLMGSGDGELS